MYYIFFGRMEIKFYCLSVKSFLVNYYLMRLWFVMMKKIDVKILDLCVGKEFLFLIYVIFGFVGFDLCVCFNDVVELVLGDIMLVLIGLVIYIVDFLLAVMMLLCFGLGYKYGIVFGNLVGLIDFDY